MLIKRVESRGRSLPDAVQAALAAGRKYIDSLVIGGDLGGP